MINSAQSCANCGKPLPSPDAVCTQCERELSVDPGSGRYLCPNCGCRFDRPVQAWWPPKAPWYLPQTEKRQCPHCRSFLRDRKAVPSSSSDWGIITVLVIVSVFSPWRPDTQFVLLIFVGVVQFVRWRRARSSVHNEEDRYTIETTDP